MEFFLKKFFAQIVTIPAGLKFILLYHNITIHFTPKSSINFISVMTKQQLLGNVAEKMKIIIVIIWLVKEKQVILKVC